MKTFVAGEVAIAFCVDWWFSARKTQGYSEWTSSQCIGYTLSHSLSALRADYPNRQKIGTRESGYLPAVNQRGTAMVVISPEIAREIAESETGVIFKSQCTWKELQVTDLEKFLSHVEAVDVP